MQVTVGKAGALVSLIIGVIAISAYAASALTYYQPRSEAQREHDEITSLGQLESINAQIQILELRIRRIVDRAEAHQRPLTPGELQEIESLREEIRLYNNRRAKLLER